ncbi:MAG: sigma-70 family RNA polymerase sigma factor, partial [bacterium]|nr:sigma-70 family RNA polymerase sigma factor [bacterium]
MHDLQGKRHPKPAHGSLDPEVAAYIAGDNEAGGTICEALEPVIRAEVRRFLPDADAEHDDVVQETLLGLLAYLNRAGRGPDCLDAFVVTMAGNRCRNLYRWRKRRPSIDVDSASDWLRAPDSDPMEALEEREKEQLVRNALSQLDAPCRKLLLEIYSEQRSMQELQREAGLGTVQGVYHRKYV